MDKEKGLRYNDQKLRYDLLEPYAIEQLAAVFTKGAEKYEPNNWLKGLPWMDVVASLERHIAAFKRGEDIDYDKDCQQCQEGTCKSHTGLLHMAHAAWNALAIVSYYKHRPEFDNRNHAYLNRPRLALDIDDVLASWIKPWSKLHGNAEPTAWQFDRAIGQKFEDMKGKKLDEFYSNLPILTPASDIPWEPSLYVTARPVDSSVTEAWLDKHGFPAAPVCTVGIGNSKLNCLIEHGIQVMVDDNFDNFVAINKAGINCYLFDQPHNQRHEVGYKRIHSLKELIW